MHGIHGKMGCCGCSVSGPLLIWMILDEDTAAYSGYENQGHCGCYEEEDTKKLRELYNQYPFLVDTTVCNRVAASSSSWWVSAKPPGVRLRDWARPPSLDTLKEDFRSDIKRLDSFRSQIHFYTIVDNSGSMTTATIQSTWNPFLRWLNEEYSREDERFVQVHTTSSGFPERWILFIQEPMKAYLDTLKVQPQSLMVPSFTLEETEYITEGLV